MEGIELTPEHHPSSEPIVKLGKSPAAPADTETWQVQAACINMNPDIFVSDQERRWSIAAWQQRRLAKQVCQGCVVREACLEFAIDNNIDHGVWGGTTPRQREHIVRRREHHSNRSEQRELAFQQIMMADREMPLI